MYEMQWTIWYFAHKSKFWSDAFNDRAEHNLSPDASKIPEDNAGALSYSMCKQSSWAQLAIKSDRRFKIVNNAYISPLWTFSCKKDLNYIKQILCTRVLRHSW